MGYSDEDSSSSSSSSSSSESESDYEDMSALLSKIGLRKKYGRLFVRAKVDNVGDAKDLTDKKLKSLGVESSGDRKKIIRAIEDATSSDDSDSSSESDSDSDSGTASELERALKSNGLKKHLKVLSRNKVSSLKAVSRLDDRKLRKFGIDSSEDRKKILRLGRKRSNSAESQVVKCLKRDPSLRKYTDLIVKEANVKTLGDAKRLSDRRLKKLGIKSSRHREKLIKAFAKATVSDAESKKVVAILSKAKLKDYAKVFMKNNINTVAKASDLSSSELKKMGVDTLSERQAILKAFKSAGKRRNRSASASSDSEESNSDSDSDSDVENELIYKVLKTINLEKYTPKFTRRDIISVRAAQALGHTELKDMGFDHVGQRDILIAAFQEADWKCIYCHEWNEFRKTCIGCTKARRDVGTDSKFTMDQSVKYVGKFRPTTRVKSGDKGEIHRVLADEHYMVKIKKGDKLVKIRLRQDELAAC